MTNDTGQPETAQSQVKRLRPLARLLPFIRPYLPMVLIGLLMLSAAAGATLAMPIAVRQMIDTGFSNEARDEVAGAFQFLLVVVALLAVFSAGRFYCVTWLGERIVADLRNAVFVHLTRLSPVFFDSAKTGEVLSRLTSDTTVIQGVVGVNASIALRNIVMVIGGLVLMFLTNPVGSLIFLATGPGVILPLFLIGRRVRKLSRASQDRIADTSALAGEVIQSMATVQAFGQEQNERIRFGGAVETAFKTAERRILVRALMTAVAIFVSAAAVVGVLWIGADQVMSGEQSAGVLVQFIVYAVLVAASIGALGEVWGEVQRASGAAERLMELLDLEPTIKDHGQVIDIPKENANDIVFDKVSFSYPTRAEETALNDVSLQISSGETVAFVGPSGAGKSTLFKLLLRFYDPTAGEIRIGGVPLPAAGLVDLRSQISFVSQDAVVFSGTISENIGYGRAGATHREIEAAAKAAGAHDFIREFPARYETLLGERGITLSGGQRQRVALARAFLKDAPILLLDEPTAALDSAVEAEIQQALNTLRQGRTCLIIAHRLSTVSNADRIFVLENGQIAGMGTHEKLIEDGGLYAELVRLQILDGAA